MVTVVKDTNFDAYLEFPCQFTFKVVGVAHDDLVPMVIATLHQHAGPNDYAPAIKPSAKGNYHSVSVKVMVTSKTHIELLYTELGKLELVRYVM